MNTPPKLERGNGRSKPVVAPATEPPVGDLLKQLGSEGAALMRSELALAKLEMREMAREVVIDSARLFGALALLMTGFLALLAAAVIGLGDALAGRYALAALIIGVVTVALGGLFARSGLAGLKQGRSPRQTVASLKETKHWASHEIREFKDEIRA